MSGYIVRAGKRNIAFGMLWTVLSGVVHTRTEIKHLAEDHNAGDYVSFPVDGKRILIGLLSKDFYTEKRAVKSKANAAAIVLSTVYKGVIENAMFGIVLPNDKVAVIGFRDGLPLVGFDRVVSYQDIVNVVDDYLQVLKEQAPSAVFYGRDDVFQGRNPAPFELDWFAQTDPSKLSGTRLRRVKKPVGLIVSLVVFSAAIFVGFHYFDQYQQEQAKKAQIKIIDPNRLYEQSVSKSLSAAGYPAIEVAWQMIDTINRLPLHHQGWKLDNAACTPGSCVLSWSNGDGGTFQTFAAAALPGVAVQKTEYKEGLTTIETTVEYPVTGKPGVQLQLIPTLDEYVMNFGSRAQKLKEFGAPLNLQKAIIIGLPPVLPGQLPITENVLKNPIKEGSWSLTGDWMLYDALRGLPNNMTIQKLDLVASGESISMTVNGKYYVKK